MAKKYIDIEIEGEEKIQATLVRREEMNGRMLRELIDELADAASLALIVHVPQRKNYIMNHIARAGPTWMPGGAYGGGEYKAIVGIKEGTSRHPLYVEFGTGIYAGRGLIWPKGIKGLSGTNQKVMVLDKDDKPRFRYWVSGQVGQHYFYNTWQTLSAVARAKIIAKKFL